MRSIGYLPLIVGVPPTDAVGQPCEVGSTVPLLVRAELAADQGDCRDKKVLQALVTAGALVALADGHLENVERDELAAFLHRQDFAPTISYFGIAKALDNRSGAGIKI